jgi:hypothetical protein
MIEEKGEKNRPGRTPVDGKWRAVLPPWTAVLP